MKRYRLNFLDEIALSDLRTSQSAKGIKTHGTQTHSAVPYSSWIRILRHELRMTQAKLAERTGLTQGHLASIESGKISPRIDTLRKIFEGLSCDIVIEPRPKKALEEILRNRARAIALKRLKHVTGTMSLEGQALEAEMFRRLLEKRTNDVLADRREKLWDTPG